MRRLIQQSLEFPHKTVQPLIACSQMFRILADVKWIQSGSFETISTSFASAVLTKFIELVIFMLSLSCYLFRFVSCFLNSNFNRHMTIFFLYRFGFEEALKVCSFFQFSDFPNGIICLLHHASRITDENLTKKGINSLRISVAKSSNRHFLNNFFSALGVARTYWPEWKVSVTFASIMICLENLEEANRLLQNV